MARLLPPTPLADRIAGRMRRYQRSSVTRAELYARFPLVPSAAIDEALRALLACGRLRVTAGAFYLPGRGRGR